MMMLYSFVLAHMFQQEMLLLSKTDQMGNQLKVVQHSQEWVIITWGTSYLMAT